MELNWFREKGKCIIGAGGAIDVVNLPSLVVSIRTIVCNDVTVFLTEQASQMVSRDAISAITGRSTVTGFFDPTREAIDIFRTLDAASLVLVCPASANLIGKIAHGIADDVVTTAVLFSSCPVIIVPSIRIAGLEQTDCSEQHFGHKKFRLSCMGS